MFVYKKELCPNEELRPSGLLYSLQEAAGEHCDLIGLGQKVIGPKGLMWVIIRQYLEVDAWPKAGQNFEIHTWPGDTRHMFFPRFYLLKTPEGDEFGRGSALWALVDRTSRKMISPGAYGIVLEGLKTGEECRLPSAAAKLPLGSTGEYTVPAEVLDINGHMNNTRYYDVAEAALGEAVRGRELRAAMTEYVSEAREGDRIELSWGSEGDRHYITGSLDGKICFRMSLEYD